MQDIVTQHTYETEADAADESSLDFTELFQAHYSRIYSFLRYRVNVLEDTEDLIGVVFEQAYTRRTQFNPDKGSFEAWLFRIAHNSLIDFYRRQGRRSRWLSSSALPPDLAMPEHSPEMHLIHEETVRQLLHSLARLSERDQEVISLKFAGRLKNKDIAEILDMKEKTVSVTLLRALRRLRQQMDKEAV